MKNPLNIFFISCCFFIALRAYGKPGCVEQQNHLFNGPESAVYFQYAGIVLSPIYPIFISSEKPLETQLKVIFKRHVLNSGDVNRFIVSGQDLNAIVRKINKALKHYKGDPESIDQHRVAVGVMVNGHLFRWTLSHVEVIPLLTLVQRASVGKYDGLYKSVIYFKFRLGVALTDKEKKAISGEL